MATSGSADYSIDRDTLIKEAMQLVGGLGEGVSPNSTQIADYSRTLNLMLKAWQAYGLQLWTIETADINLAASTSSYTLGPAGTTGLTERPLKVVEVYLRDTDSNDTPLLALSRNEYVRIADKTTTGNPTQWYYDPQLTNGVLYVWPAPDTTSAAYTLKVVYQSPIEDMDSASDEFDLPQEWYEAIKYGLAVRLAPVFGMPYNDRLALRAEAKEILDLALSWDTEQESIYLQVKNM